MRSLSSFNFTSSTSESDIADVLGLNWDSTNNVAYAGTDANNGFYMSNSGGTLSIKPFVNGSAYGNAVTLTSQIYYIKNDDETACAFGGFLNISPAMVQIALVWAEAQSPIDTNKHYVYATTYQASWTGGHTLWADNGTGYQESWSSIALSNMSLCSSQMVSLAPLAMDKMTNTGNPSLPRYTHNLYYVIVCEDTINYSIVTLNGYDYIILSRINGGSYIKLAMKIGETA